MAGGIVLSMMHEIPIFGLIIMSILCVSMICEFICFVRLFVGAENKLLLCGVIIRRGLRPTMSFLSLRLYADALKAYADSRRVDMFINVCRITRVWVLLFSIYMITHLVIGSSSCQLGNWSQF